jgi:digeranylgeranylglycerophospholipid reductase
MKLIETDVLVIGAGPAGSSSVKHAALNGAEVI